MDLQTVHKHVQQHAELLALDIDCISTGDPNAIAAIVSDYPGETEAVTKVPLTGTSGKALWRLFQKYNIADQRQFYISNAIKEVVARNANAKQHLLWKEVLLAELALLPNLKYVFAMGGQATAMLTGEDNVTNWRGSVVELQLGTRTIYVMPTFNPAYVFEKDRTTQQYIDTIRIALLLLDCRKFVRLVANGYTKHRVNHIVIRTLKQFDRLCNVLLAAEYVSYDIEHWNRQTACIGFAVSSHFTYVLPFCDTEKSLWSAEDELYIRMRLQKVFDTTKAKFIGQNCMTDATWLWFKDRIRPPKHWFDTMLAHHYLYSTMPHSLAALTTQYTWHPYYKDEGTEWLYTGDMKKYWGYNAKDCALTFHIAFRLYAELRNRGLLDSFMSNVIAFDAECIRTTALGIQTDKAQVIKYDIEYTQKLEAQRNDLYAIIAFAVSLDEFREVHANKVRGNAIKRAHKAGVGELAEKRANDAEKRFTKNSDFKLSSHEHLKTLFVLMHLPGAEHVSTDKYQFDSWLNSYSVSEDKKDILRKIQQQRKDEKFYSTYVKVRLDNDNRCRYQYNQTGTRTAPGRLSGSQNFWHTGTNMQNQTGRARAQFIADCDEIILHELDGYERLQICEEYGELDPYVFIYIDGEQAEARYVAYCAVSPKYPDGIVKWQEEFEYARTHPGELDCHRALAARMFNKPYAQIPKDDWISEGVPSERYLGKRARHGLNYRMYYPTFAIRTNISESQAQYIYSVYHKETPELRAWWQHEDELAKTNLRSRRGAHIIRNSFGRELVYHCEFTDKSTESIIAFKPQSSIGDWMKVTWLKCHNDARWPHDKGRLLLNVHDAIIGMVKRSVAKTCLKIMIEHAETPIIVNDKPLIIPASAMLSYPDEFGKHRWSNMQKVHL